MNAEQEQQGKEQSDIKEFLGFRGSEAEMDQQYHAEARKEKVCWDALISRDPIRYEKNDCSKRLDF